MYYNEIIDCLQKLIYKKPTQQELADILGIRQTAVAGRAKRNSAFTKDEIKKIENYFNVIILSNDKTVIVDYYPEKFGSFKNGSFITDENKISYEMSASIFPNSENKKYSIIHAHENSMYPLIWKNDYVIIEHESDFINGDIYSFYFENEIYIKRLTKNINQFVINSENPDFPVQFIEKDCFNDIYIIGKVLYTARSMNDSFIPV